MAKSKKQKLKDKAWNIFSKYIRARDCIKFSGTLKIGKCVTCKKVVKNGTHDCQAGHYISRKHLATIFDERNVHIQCCKCNTFQHGNLKKYKDYMISRYGEKLHDSLMSLRWTQVKLDYEEIISIYKKKLSEITQLL